MEQPMKRYALAVGTLFILAFTATKAVSAQDTSLQATGAMEYRISCATCHGQDGRGEGPLASVLKTKPTDLTQLSKNNHGAFPFLKILQIIDGRAEIGAHGTRDMPAFGGRYEEEAGQAYGPYGGETVVRARILELVYYLQTIQKE
jgi:mono/diheme cytochrome c family protein